MTSSGQNLLRPFQTFFRMESASGVMLLVAAAIALVWSNSSWADSYQQLWHHQTPTAFGLPHTVLHWINDGLMAVFFLLVGLEIKREMIGGELSSLKNAALPLIAAAGGMAVPALIYVAIILAGGATRDLRGWAVPTATDIAFALGVLSLVGRRAPVGLKVFLAALAIADDLGAVLVIALFYTSKISFIALAAALLVLAMLVIANRLRTRSILVYLLLGAALWFCVLKSGVHASVAGVLLAMTIPAAGRSSPGLLQELEHALHPWVAFAIMPLFAIANAGVQVQGGLLANLRPVTVGVFFGLWVGKQIGVMLFAWMSVKAGLATLPRGAMWRHFYGMSCLCGIGFTMSIFIASLAFTSTQTLDSAKTGILAASSGAAVLGFIILMTARPAEDA